MKNIALLLFILTLSLVSISVQAQELVSHPSGTLINQDGTIYRINQGQKTVYPDPVIFHSWGFNFEEVVLANDADRALPVGSVAGYRDGSLVADHGTVYIIFEGEKYGFSSAQVFLDMNYKFSNVISGDLSGYPEGPAITYAERPHGHATLVSIDGTIYLTFEGQRVGIPSMEVFNWQRYDLAKVVEGTPYDWFLQNNGILSP